MATSTCPTASQFLDLVHGKIAGPEAETLLRHCVDCKDCGATLARYNLSDTLLNRVQQAATGDSSLSPELVARVRQRFGAAAMEQTPLTGAAPDGTVAEYTGDAAEKQWSALLQPATGNEELGWLGQYRILKVLGTGGMGRVFLAEETHLKRRVALKVMSPALIQMPHARERFLREARAAAAIKDDHIVTIYQVGQVDDVPFLAMELLAGESLEERLLREGMLTVADAVRIGRDVAQGLAVAHADGLVHRDIKPANLWLEVRGKGSGVRNRDSGGLTRPLTPDSSADWRVKLLDFGLARAGEGSASITASGQILGTPHYMSPEQARGAAVDGRSDLFSLGCVLYECVAGREPFDGDTIMAVLTALATQTPKPLRDFQPDLPDAFVELVERLLKKNPDERPASAAEVVEALREFEPPPSSGPRTSGPRTSGSFFKAPSRKPVWRQPAFWAGALGAIVIAVCAFFLLRGEHDPTPSPGPVPLIGAPIHVGILQSTSGTLAASGLPVADATTLAIEEINKDGGIKGRPIEYLLRDGQSDPDVFAAEAEKLITQDKVSAIFGCWTSSGRKKVKEVVEKHGHLLLYPVQYEGLEQSPNIVYLGPTPNQQIIPAVRYCFTELHKRRYFLVGSDYVFPHAAHEIIKEELASLGAKVVGEAFLQLGETDVGPVIDRIVKAKPDVILNCINGDTNRPFFHELRRADIRPDKTPTVSFSIAEPELRLLGGKDMIGDYAAWSYFMSLPDPANKEFIERFRAKFGATRRISDPMLCAYASVHLWAEAAEKAGSPEPAKVLSILREEDFEGPGGLVKIDPETLHAWKRFRLGRVVEGNTFEVVWSSDLLVRPQPYLKTRSREAWDQFVWGLYKSWGNRWENPGR